MSKFGQYELLDRIAVGGMAEIYRGRALGEEGFEKLVAIKRILPSYARDSRFVSMLVTEARIHAALSHRNIVQIQDLGISQDGEYFIVLEYVDGGDLTGLLSRIVDRAGRAAAPSRLPDAVALHIAIELGEGMHFAHELAGPDGQALALVHRDISPSNVLLSYAGEVKLSDFGLAKRRTDHSVVGSLKGKLAYMSPEQARRGPIDRRSDLFALGAVLFEMLSGQPLREITDDVSGWQQVASGLVPPARRYREDLPDELERLLAGALAPDPRDRFADAKAFVTAARAALERLPRSRVGETGELQALLKAMLPPGSPRPTKAPSRVIRLVSEFVESDAAPLVGGEAVPPPSIETPPPSTTDVTAIAPLPWPLVGGARSPAIPLDPREQRRSAAGLIAVADGGAPKAPPAPIADSLAGRLPVGPRVPFPRAESPPAPPSRTATPPFGSRPLPEPAARPAAPPPVPPVVRPSTPAFGTPLPPGFGRGAGIGQATMRSNVPGGHESSDHTGRRIVTPPLIPSLAASSPFAPVPASADDSGFEELSSVRSVPPPPPRMETPPLSALLPPGMSTTLVGMGGSSPAFGGMRAPGESPFAMSPSAPPLAPPAGSDQGGYGASWPAPVAQPPGGGHGGFEQTGYAQPPGGYLPQPGGYDQSAYGQPPGGFAQAPTYAQPSGALDQAGYGQPPAGHDPGLYAQTPAGYPQAPGAFEPDGYAQTGYGQTGYAQPPAGYGPPPPPPGFAAPGGIFYAPPRPLMSAPYPGAEPPPSKPRPSILGGFVIVLVIAAIAAAAVEHFTFVPLQVLAVWRQPARLDVTSDPPGAEVFIDGRLLSALTPTYTDVQRDRALHMIELRRQGYRTEHRVIQYDQSLELTLSVRLDAGTPGVEPLTPTPKAKAKTAR